jgi:uncharacterized protein YndB with AHSA1/START domain
LTRERRVEASARTDIEASPAVVYRWITAPDRVVSWVKDLVESRPLADGATLEVGARSIEVLRVGRTLQEVPSEVTALQPDRLIEIRLEAPGGSSTSRVLIAETATGCTVTQTMVSVFEGMRFLPSSIVTKLLAQRLNGDLRRLKKLVESD